MENPLNETSPNWWGIFQYLTSYQVNNFGQLGKLSSIFFQTSKKNMDKN